MSKNPLLILLLISAAVCLPLILFQDDLATDSYNYYVPMIRAFSNSNWDGAFYPMIPPLFCLTGGVVGKILPFSAFTIAKLISSLAFVLTVIPLYKLITVTINKKAAWIGSLMFIFCSRLIRYSGMGHLTTYKIFLLVSILYCFVMFLKSKKYIYALFSAVCSAALILLRVEGIVLVMLIFLLSAVLEVRSGKKKFQLPVKSFCAGILTLILVLPWMFYEYKSIGYPVTDSRQIRLIQALPEPMQKLLKNPDYTLSHEENIINPTYDFYQASVDKIKENSLWERLYVEIFKGLYPPYLIFVIAGIVIRIRKREFTKFDFLFAGLITVHTLLMAVLPGGGWTQKRYIIPVLPFMLPWGASGFLYLHDCLRKRISPKWLRAAVGIFIAVSLFDGYSKIKPESKPEKIGSNYLATRAYDWIRLEGPRYMPENAVPLVSTDFVYHNGSLPIIITNNCKIACHSNSDKIFLNYYTNNFSLEQLTALCRKKRVHFIVSDEEMLRMCPELDQPDQSFKELGHFHYSETGQKLTILGFTENLSPGI